MRAASGPALPQTEVKIVAPGGADPLPIGILGELCVRGYLLMTGCFDNADGTAAALDGDGWLHTGVLATMDERGYCRVQRRLKDMIIRGGENICPREIEELLFAHPAVGDAAVVGIPDSRRTPSHRPPALSSHLEDSPPAFFDPVWLVRRPDAKTPQGIDARRLTKKP